MGRYKQAFLHTHFKGLKLETLHGLGLCRRGDNLPGEGIAVCRANLFDSPAERAKLEVVQCCAGLPAGATPARGGKSPLRAFLFTYLKPSSHKSCRLTSQFFMLIEFF